MIALLLLLLAAMLSLLIALKIVVIIPFLPVGLLMVIGAMIIRYSHHRNSP